jgi:MAE_28990/MAE_18760-like HEPN
MNISQLWSEMEEDLSWRLNELRFFQNQLALLDSEQEQQRFRRALVLLLYAHFEGYCKFALTLYVNYINRTGITCGDVTFAIAAASLSDVFKALRNPEKKIPEFRNSLPDDTKLHQFGREREFVERTAELADRPVKVADDVVDTESNLRPVVLRKNLYRLGFAPDQFADHEGSINQLLEYRNKIAHGDMQAGLSRNSYDTLRAAVYEVMNEIKSQVMKAIHDRSYLRTA